MKRYTRGVLLLLVGVALIFTVDEAAAQPERDRDQPRLKVQPPEEGDREEMGRPGGIPRKSIAPRERGDEGGQDGVPEFKEESRVAPMLKLDPGAGGGPWKLGVYAYNTESGVVITRVVRGTAAAEVGLERGDRIVTVDGFQVGYVDDMLYPLGHELQRQADRRGRVLLLVQNVRNDELVNLPVPLDRGRFD